MITEVRFLNTRKKDTIVKKLVLLLMIISLSCSLCSCSVTDVTTAVDILKNEFLYKSADEYIDPSGTVNGYVYTNEFLGLSYRINSSWGYYNEDEALAFLGLTQEDMADYEFYDMLASDTYRGNYLSVYFLNVGLDQMATLDLDKYLNDKLTATEEYFTTKEFKNISSKITKVKIDEKKLDAICLSYDINGINGYTTQVIFPYGEYLVFITVETSNTDTTEDILDNFSWLD